MIEFIRGWDFIYLMEDKFSILDILFIMCFDWIVVYKMEVLLFLYVFYSGMCVRFVYKRVFECNYECIVKEVGVK